jgi:uncharacterized protein (DUF885 family)
MNELAVTRRDIVGISVALAALPGPVLARSGDDTVRFYSLLERLAAADMRALPLSDDRIDPPFVDPLTDSFVADARAETEAQSHALATISRDALAFADRLAFDVVRYRLDQERARVDHGVALTALRAPLDPSFGLHIEFPDLFAGARYRNVADYETGLKRLAGFAGYLDSTIMRLREGLAAGQVQPRIIVRNVIAQVDAMLALPIERSPFYAPLARLPDGMPGPERARLTAAYVAAIGGPVYAGYRAWQVYLRDTYLAQAPEGPGRWAMKGGDALYANEIMRHTTTKLPADQIHTLGLSEVARIRDAMEKARVSAGFTSDLRAFFDYIRTDPRFYCKTPEELLGRFSQIEARIWESIPKLFARRPDAPFEVQPLPALGEQRGTGYYRAGPPDGKTPGVLYFNMAMLNTRPIPTLETLTLHEGIPGHHFQINLAHENARLPTILRFSGSESFTAFTEGWGLYAESLGKELGMFGDPFQWFGHLDMEMLRAVRLVVDTGIHARRWPRQQAIDYMLANTSMAPRDVAVEIDRYIAAPGQACAYKMGELKISTLRETARQTLRARFDIRDYHDQVLGTGALPLDVLQAKIAHWIKAGGGPAASGF